MNRDYRPDHFSPGNKQSAPRAANKQPNFVCNECVTPIYDKRLNSGYYSNNQGSINNCRISQILQRKNNSPSVSFVPVKPAIILPVKNTYK